MVLALQWYCGDNVKYGLLSKHLFQRKLQYGWWNNLKVTTNFNKKQWLSVIKWNQKHSPKKVVSIKRTLDKKFFVAAFLKVCESFLLRQMDKTCSALWSLWVLFAFLEKRRPNKYCLREVNLVSCMQIFSLICQCVNLVWNIVV